MLKSSRIRVEIAAAAGVFCVRLTNCRSYIRYAIAVPVQISLMGARRGAEQNRQYGTEAMIGTLYVSGVFTAHDFRLMLSLSLSLFLFPLFGDSGSVDRPPVRRKWLRAHKLVTSC